MAGYLFPWRRSGLPPDLDHLCPYWGDECPPMPAWLEAALRDLMDEGRVYVTHSWQAHQLLIECAHLDIPARSEPTAYGEFVVLRVGDSPHASWR
jgi:hypothetical protein